MRACLVLWAALVLAPDATAMGLDQRTALRDEVRDMFHHGYTGYLEHAYPADELRPISCLPLERDPDPSNVGVNDIHANISMTLVDSLSALPLILPTAYPDALERVSRISFDQDVKVQVFEMTIRALGALLSTYQRLSAMPDDPEGQAAALGLPGKVEVKHFAPRMLELALDLGERLVPAFKTATGLPYARVNLRHGVELRESIETCTAGAGSLVLEFTLLSRLSGDPRFEELARKAFMALWNRRSKDDLVGNGIGVALGQWIGLGFSGVNAGIDSFFEYALKAAIMLDDSAYMDIFQDAYAAIQTHVRTSDGFIYRPVTMRGLLPAQNSVIDSLSSFFPGVQVLNGDLESAIQGHLVYWNLWRRYGAIPESWEHHKREIGWAGWPGRPEFIESTYYLHRATGDDFYLRVGERVLRDILRRTVTPCGFATISNVETGALQDRMESFMLSETLKYLYLLFDPTPSAGVSNTVFTTEGHPLRMPHNLTTAPGAAWRFNHRREDLYCPAYRPQTVNGRPVGIESRDDYDYARFLVFGDDKSPAEDHSLWGYGTCRVPQVPKFAFEMILTPADTTDTDALPPHDPSPPAAKVHQLEDGDWVINNIDGLHLGCRWRLDGSGYDVSSIGPHRVRQGQNVLVTDHRMDGYLPQPPMRPESIWLTVEGKKEHTLAAATAHFGRPFGETLDSLLIVRGDRGCEPLRVRTDRAFALVVKRGDCTFADKAFNAAQSGARLLIIVNDEKGLLRPSAFDEDDEFDAAVQGLSIALVDQPVDGTEVSFTGTPKQEGKMLVGEHGLVNIRVVG